MLKRCATFLTLIFVLVSSQQHGLAANTAEEAKTARYVFVDGSFEVLFDREERVSTSTSFPKGGPRIREGRIITDTISYGYGDCSTTEIVCADLDDFVLASPRWPADIVAWEYNGWRFRRTACLQYRENACERYLAVFENKLEGREGGFIFSNDHGIEMHFDSKTSRQERRQIYVLASRYGLLHGGKP